MPASKPCCAKCRRGIKGFGELPCGYDLKCKCHTQDQSGNIRAWLHGETKEQDHGRK